MPVLKVRCPECSAPIRETIDAVDEPTEFTVTCPKCDGEFSATAEPEARPVKSDKKKPIKSSKRRDDDEADEDDDTPRRKKKKKRQEAKGPNAALIAGAIGVAVLLIGGVVAAVTLSGKDSGKDIAKVDAGQNRPAADAPSSNGGSNASNSGANSSGSGKKPPAGDASNGSSAQPASDGSTSQPDGGSSAPAGNVPPTNTSDANRNPQQKLPPLPPPPKLRLHWANATVGGRLESSEGERAKPPLAPDEDPFVRAKNFRMEGSPPPIPKLPPANQRPILALDSGGHTGMIQNVFIAPAMFKISEKTIAALKAEGVPDAVLTKLLPLKGKDYTRGDLLIEVNKLLTVDEMKQYQLQIAKDAATPFGERVITVAEDKTVRIWDSKTGSTINTIRFPAGVGEEGALRAAALSSKGRLAVTGDPIAPAKAGGAQPNVIFILSVDTGAIVKTMNAASPVISLHFSSDGNRLAVGCASGTVQIFDSTTGNQVARNEEGVPINEVRFNPEPKSQVLAILTAAGQLRIVDLKNPSRTVSYNASSLSPWTIAWSYDARHVAVGGTTGEIGIFEVGGQTVRRISPHTNNGSLVAIYQLQYLPGDTGILYGGTASWCGIISPDSGKVKVSFTKHTDIVSAVCSSADGKTIATSGGNQNETYLWEASSGKVISRLSGAGKGFWGIGWSKDGKSIGWGTSSKVEQVNDNRALEEIFRLDDLGPGGPAHLVKFQQAQDTDDIFTVQKGIVKTQRGATMYAVAFQAGKENRPEAFIMPGEEIYSVSILPGRGKAVLGGKFGLYIYDMRTKERRTFSGATGRTLSVAPSPDGKYFVTGSSDQTIRIWQPELDEPLLSIFLSGREWIAWNNQGFYACSPHGEQLLAWQVNNTATKLPTVYPAERFRASLYQPALIKYLIPAGTVQYAMSMAQKFDKALVQLSSVADVLPPDASFDASLADDLVVDQDTFKVKASAKGSPKTPITAMRLMVDGRPFQGTKGIKRFDSPAETGEASWDVPLTPGPHTFAVIAETPVSKGMTKTATITRKGDVAKPNLYVLAMGVSDYPAPMKLNFGASDAVLLGNSFQKYCKGAFANIEVRILTDKDATKKGMQTGLDWLASKMTAKDVGIVSFSGHGAREDGKFYLVPVDVSKDVASSCFAGAEFKARLDNMPGRLVAILDACHSGNVAESIRPPASADALVQDLSSEDSGVIVMCASLGREYSLESPMTKAGFYTFGIVEGLQNLGEIDDDGVINIKDLELYAYHRARQLSHGAQNSTMSMPPGIRSFPMAVVPKSDTGSTKTQ